MNRMMLIEDEPPILHMIKGMIESSSQGFVVSHTAFNGAKALKMLEDGAKPDLIVTDIRMPVMDGLQFMRELSERGYEIPCIIMSGYSDFNYAREALQQNAWDYLLKPLKEDHLEQALAKASVMLRKRKSKAERAYMKRALQLADDFGEEQPANPGYLHYQLLLIRRGSYRTGAWEDRLSSLGDLYRRWDDDAMEAAISPEWKADPVWWISGWASNERIVVRALMDPQSGAVHREVAESMLATWASHAETDEGAVNMAVSVSVTVERLAVTLRTLREALARETRFGESRVWMQGDMRRPGFVLSSELDQACRSLAHSANYETFEKAMQGWVREWRKEGYGQLEVESLFAAIVRSFQTYWPKEIASTIAAFDANELVSGCRTLDEAVKQFCGYMKEGYASLVKNRPDRSAKDLMEDVRRYLDEHLMEPIGSDELQLVFGYNKTYISNVFSEVFGMPPGKYLSKLRIDKAIVLIFERPELSLRQIAELVGYEDSLYFSKVFKNATGLSPREYKERREKDGHSGGI
ncbi:response regulator [Paenibacillus sp. B2(2019)]|uniref:response regulator n=1 Tax=Paenibacillus sp. B2(2019) TaxID=2607754 RepID=UPI0011F34207|nr:response regulator [Paenibacillus sp. B2(2019)]KAA1183415.1 response regulator [Paenibacillus sp. B2(2019)]